VSGPAEERGDRYRLARYLWVFGVLWAAIVTASLAFNVVRVERDTLELARLQARAAYDRDLAYRRWNTDRAPVYFAESPDAPPNPYLSAEPERDILTPSGRRLTMANPDYMMRQVDEMVGKTSGVRAHLTSLNPVRRENAPDAWEAKALRDAERGRAEVSSVQELDGHGYMRLLRPLVAEPHCLKCHSAQGYRVGDIMGGISTSVPMGPLQAIAWRHVAALALGHALVGLVGLCGIVLAGRRLLVSQAVIAATNAKLAERHRQLQETYERLNREFRTVGDVQVSLLPGTLPDIPGFEVATHYRPATQAGGDYFDFFALPDGKWGVVVADVSGHGAPAAVLMAMVRTILHVSGLWTPPNEVLSHLNRDLQTSVQPDQFVTVLYGVLDPLNRTFTFSSAGHCEPIYLDPSQGRARLCTAETGFPISVTADARYPVSSIVLEHGAVLVLYTDGVTEAFDESGEQFGQERLIDGLQALQGSPAASVRDALLESLDKHRGPVQLADDVTLLIFRALLEGAPATRKDASLQA
jgi:serine phosphatase RsbU (regulator of sigma subunit)